MLEYCRRHSALAPEFHWLFSLLQVILPEGYLADVYREMHAAGALCIADEVQCGFGRVGRAFWAFELQGVVPDIVTCGKPVSGVHSPASRAAVMGPSCCTCLHVPAAIASHIFKEYTARSTIQPAGGPRKGKRLGLLPVQMGNGYPVAALVTSRAIADRFAAGGMEFFATFAGSNAAIAAGEVTGSSTIIITVVLIIVIIAWPETCCNPRRNPPGICQPAFPIYACLARWHALRVLQRWRCSMLSKRSGCRRTLCAWEGMLWSGFACCRRRTQTSSLMCGGRG